MLPIKHLHDNGIFEGIVERPDKAYLELKAEQRSVISPGDLIPLEAPTDKRRGAAERFAAWARGKNSSLPPDRHSANAGLRRGSAQAGRHDRQCQQRRHAV